MHFQEHFLKFFGYSLFCDSSIVYWWWGKNRHQSFAARPNDRSFSHWTWFLWRLLVHQLLTDITIVLFVSSVHATIPGDSNALRCCLHRNFQLNRIMWKPVPSVRSVICRQRSDYTCEFSNYKFFTDSDICIYPNFLACTVRVRKLVHTKSDHYPHFRIVSCHPPIFLVKPTTSDVLSACLYPVSWMVQSHVWIYMQACLSVVQWLNRFSCPASIFLEDNSAICVQVIFLLIIAQSFAYHQILIYMHVQWSLF